MNAIKFKSIYQERVWGGRWLAEKFGRELPGEKQSGEVYGAGTSLLLPYSWQGELVSTGTCTTLVTDRFG